MDDLSDDERKAIVWLEDKNDIQRNVRRRRDGSTEVVAEHDISGGHASLVRLLRESHPLHPDVRAALANALDPFDDSILQLIKRPRRKRGRPAHDTMEDAVRRAYEVAVVPAKLNSEMQKARLPAAGMKPKKISKGEAVSRVAAEESMSRTRVYAITKIAKRRKSQEK